MKIFIYCLVLLQGLIVAASKPNNVLITASSLGGSSRGPGKDLPWNMPSLRFNRQEAQRKLSIDTIVDGLSKDLEPGLSEIQILISKVAKYWKGLPIPIQLIISANIAVWAMWQIAADSALADHFEEKSSSGMQGKIKRWYTWLTSQFSHKRVLSLSINMLVFSVGGSVAHGLLGTKLFTGYLTSAAVVIAFVPKLLRTVASRLSNHPRQRVNGDAIIQPMGFDGINCAMFVISAACKPKINLPTSIIEFLEPDIDITNPIDSKRWLGRFIGADLFITIVTTLLGGGCDLSRLLGYSWGLLFLEFIYRGKLGRKMYNKLNRYR